jgi:hypothetical protein
MKPNKTEKFNAVAESRRWKAAVSLETEAMTLGSVLAFFDKDRVLTALAASRRSDEPVSDIRPDPFLSSNPAL